MSAVRNAPRRPGDRGTVEIPEVQRAEVQVRADTLNEEDRMVEIVWAAGADVKRYDWWEGEHYIESLSMDPAHIRLDRFRTGMSLLDSHSAYSMDDRIGTVIPESVRIENGLGVATVRISRKQRGEELLQDLRDGHPFPVSVGYKTHAYEKTEASDTSLARLTAIDWEPMELSAVPIPADPAAHSRGEPDGPKRIKVAVENRPNKRGQQMDDDTLEAPPAQRGAPGAQAGRIRPKENARRAYFESRSDAMVHDGEKFLRDTDGMTDTEVRAHYRGLQMKYQDETSIFPHSAAATRDGGSRQDRIQWHAEAQFHRSNPSHQLSPRAGEFAGLSMPDLMRDCVEASGQSVRGLSRGEIFQRAMHTTSDFPAIMQARMQMDLRKSYGTRESDIRKIARASLRSDFRERQGLAVGQYPSLLKVNEHGEFKRGTVRESVEKSYAVATFGRVIGFTRETLVNDDVNAIEQVMRSIGRVARSVEVNTLVGLLQTNPVMADTKRLFSADHGNLGTPAALSIDSIKEAITALRKQRDLNGDFLDAVPRYLIVGSELEIPAQVLISGITTPQTSAQVIPEAIRRLEILVEPRIESPTAWYLAVSPDEIPALEYSHLEGEDQPFIATRVGWDVDGIETKVRLDFGAGWRDHRGWFFNAGA